MNGDRRSGLSSFLKLSDLIKIKLHYKKIDSFTIIQPFSENSSESVQSYLSLFEKCLNFVLTDKIYINVISLNI
jgi:hypothetical protein